MKKIFALSALLLIFSASTYSVDPRAEGKAREYKGYDELITNISEVPYGNGTYYWVEYSKNLMYSGALVIDDKYGAVSEPGTLNSFVIADIIHKNYPPDTASQWRQFSDYFFSMASAHAQYGRPGLANDSKEIAVLLNRSSYDLGRSVASFSPADARDYMAIESLAAEKMDAAYADTINYSEKDSPYLKEYKDSLTNIKKILSGNSDSLLKSSKTLTDNMLQRIGSKANQGSTDMILMSLAAVLLVFVIVMKVRRSRSSKPPQHPRASSVGQSSGRP